ncbi:hypothetical protein [Sporosarcina luteola]|uniref:hypothetical protein n=1 Tax=Sporosarcina luteola TaxID=582850 RepID=UPI00203CE7B1|nr:hypothetical protein [Sporosarcina luteola]MCM3711495.1 hypothetical protein [Sporosarcina luteola]
MSKTVEEMIVTIEGLLEKSFRKEGVGTIQNSLYHIINDYKRLIDIIEINTDKSGICMLKKTEIANLYGLSRELIKS